MKVVVQAIKFNADKKLVEFATKKVEKLEKFFDGIVKAEVSLKLGSAQNPENKGAEIKLSVPGNDLFAARECKTFEEAVDLSVEALRIQLKKVKEKMRGV